MRFPTRALLAAGISLSFLLATASSGRAVCGSDPGDPARLLAAQVAVDSQCDCCSAQGPVRYVRCVARVVKAAVHAGTLRRACKTMVVQRTASLPCPLGAASGATATPTAVCQTCRSDADCQANEFCECPPGTCSQTGGTCVARPAVCFDLVAPVCGCDGNTYANDCERRKAGVCKRTNGPCGAGQCFDTIQQQCTGQSCSAAQRCPLPNQFCVPVCPPPLPTGTCFDPAGGQCTDQSCSPSTPCPLDEFCLAQCPPPTAMCFDTITGQCTGQPCSPAQPCALPNEFCTPRCPPPPPPPTTTTLPGQMCQTDTDCDDGNPCTHDACVNGTCIHVCVCRTPAGVLACCPGPSGLCPPPSTTTSTTIPTACGTCFDTIGMQCTAQVCSAAMPCDIPNEFCSPVRCPAPCPSSTTTTTTTTLPPASCQADGDCGMDQFCECPVATCSKTGGTCVNEPQVCPEVFAPVCGCDGTTYSNDCSRQGAGACKLHDGACQQTCQADADCDDGNPCTVDRCNNGMCEHECLCVGPGGALQCCPGPAAQCPPPTTSTTTTLPGPLTWFYTCGDPVCGGHGPHPGVSPCSPGAVAGTACSPEGATCDPGDSCNQLLLCATSDPTHGGMCPISRRAYKENIHYLNDADVERLHEELMRFRLATYQYKGAPSERHLGFVIEDIEPSAAVDSGRNMVDLYGYTSMTVAALQSQAREIKVLKKEVVKLRRALQARDGAGRSTGLGSRR